MTSNRRPLPPPNAATVVAGTPKLAVSSSGPGTAPMGHGKQAQVTQDGLGGDARVPAKDAAPVPGHAPTTEQGAGMFQPAVPGAKARRAGLWGTVVGVGPSFLKSIAANKPSARADRDATAKDKPSSSNARAESAQAKASQRPEARSAGIIDSDEINSAATRISAGVPRLAAPTAVSPLVQPSSPKPSSPPTMRGSNCAMPN